MNKPHPPSCPLCGSRQLIETPENRKIFIDHEGERIPLLTANFSLDLPVIEEKARTFTCSCSWTSSNKQPDRS